MAGPPDLEEALGLAAGSARAAEVVVGSSTEVVWEDSAG